ncbi:MAG: nuclear transport factor 2 family protein [Gammaproteobacteria bacterium]|nr:nuclear transport factor 2 family protein [Gammaproteobacteria bacterium]
MKKVNLFKLLIGSFLLLTLGPAFAQDDNDEADVWATVEEEWDADEKGDRKWPDRLLSDSFSGWGDDSPAPRDKDSIKMWDRFSEQLGKMVAHELYPLSIVVHEDVAVAQYMYSSAFEDKKGEIELSNGRYTDVLVRTDDGWQFLAWHGGEHD